MLKKYPYLYEIPVVYLILFGINRYFLPELPAFSGIDPHPFWMGILLFGFRYGILPGLTAGLVSAFLYVGINWLQGERYVFEDMTFYVLPGIFIIGGTLMGLGVERYQKRISNQEKEVLLRQKNEEVLNEELKTVQEINRGLEKRIVTKMATLVTLYEGARRLEVVDLDDLYPAILEFVAKTTGAEELSFYLRNNEGWQVKTRYGLKEYRKYPQQLKMNEGIAGLAGSKNKIITIRDFVGPNRKSEEMPELLGDCLIAGPLRQGERGDVRGVICIHHIPFLSFNSATINLFGFILEWGSRALMKAAYVAELKAQEILNPDFQIYSAKYLTSRLRQEFSRSQTYYLPLGIHLIQIKNLASLDPVKRLNFLTSISALLRKIGREIDVVACHSEIDIPFAVLVITASPKQVQEIKEKIEKILHEVFDNSQMLAAGIRLKIGTANFSPQVTSTDQLLKIAMEDLGT